MPDMLTLWITLGITAQCAMQVCVAWWVVRKVSRLELSVLMVAYDARDAMQERDALWQGVRSLDSQPLHNQTLPGPPRPVPVGKVTPIRGRSSLV